MQTKYLFVHASSVHTGELLHRVLLCAAIHTPGV